MTIASNVVLSIEKTANATNVLAGDHVTFTITVTNNGPSNATEVVVADALPAGFTTTGETSFTIDFLKVDDSKVFTIDALAVNNGTWTNVANASCFENETVVSDDATVTIDSNVVLGIVKTADPTTVYVGQEVTFTINVTNYGPSNATNAVITDELDTNVFEVVEVVDGELNGNVATWKVGNIDVGDSKAVTVVVKVLEPGKFNNTAVVKCDENETETNNSTEITVLFVDFNIVKSADPSTVYVGQEVTFTIEATNNGNGTAHDAVITDELDTNVFDVVKVVDGELDGNVATWNVGDIAPGDSKAVTVVVKVLEAGKFNNTAVITCNETENKTNNSTEITVLFVDLSIVKSADPEELYVGQEVTFTIEATNNGNGTAHDAVITDELDTTVFEFVSAENGEFDGKVVTWNVGDIEPGASKAVTVVVKVLEPGTFNNTAVITCNETENKTNNSTKIVVKDKLHLIITVGNYTTTPDSDVLVEITVVDEKGAKVTIDLNVEVSDPVDTDSLPAHGKLAFTIGSKVGAETQTVKVTNGEGSFTYHVSEDATNGTSYVVTATSEETDEYYAAEGTGYIDVVQYATTTTISSATGAPGEEVTLTINVTTEDGTPFNGDVVVTCPDGTEVTVTVTDGVGEFTWTIPEDATTGTEYQFTATFNGNTTYLASSGNGTVTVVAEPVPEPPVPDEPEAPAAKVLSTGNPIVALLAAFVLIGLGLKRREEN